ncbi:hypothetical protein AKJ56_01020 [candidate division MSBL1 archaeon SCGC-AAA382N08]|uniref:Uncharacterized protein n=1 Tax=candidate division MSBL1 archaeon SCGC-AAA382N08 TaxID=1698285 RepID=A0A133VQ50_9EURY|nr:hypothetical protein AKJ56_01020 [candidate division MSBL1 archaeon SCGC-AAA382N08]
MAYENLKKTNKPQKAIDALKEVNNLNSGEKEESNKKSDKKKKDYSDLIKKVAEKKMEKE